MPKSLFAKRKRLIIRFLSACFTACVKGQTIDKNAIAFSLRKSTIIFYLEILYAKFSYKMSK